jgi:plasmid stabilization system protein ParE
MQYRVNLAERAVKDLDSIFQFIQAEQSEMAATWFNGLQEGHKVA